ncbi:MAG: polyketide cyclase / dehydrase and lipid transport [Saccharopolyspora sp.]|uniref:polyketide cyclase / dehydrase and lipid transport n=1 Tax=Saccharopolyspora TaxID=1835 RepID=UPI001909AE23|nr:MULTISPECIES: polyketide cyclase / dehydrase and lipid transport [unclassified Saccharopolyspora]MBK0868498.1 polyketide cyclase / dehydrase and lipid transport [Saccharopolyspora sp. HNM0986]MBQ6644004.1 polyketide cyclase / dehydrase and lipid transport [Saccharopolyspora sp.]
MSAIDLAEEVFLAVAPAALAPHFADPDRWPRQWPGLAPVAEADRGIEGMRWRLTGDLRGSMEVWLQPVLDGTVLHYFLRADPPGPRRGRWVTAELRRRRLAVRELVFELKSRLEAGRAPGCPPPSR